MDPLIGALLAAAVAWASILAVIHLPLDRWVPPRALRRIGAVTLVLLGLGVLGVPHAQRMAVGALLVGFVGVSLLELHRRKQGSAKR